jgi:hypothetical protein
MLHLVCGYAGTGKDSLYKMILAGAKLQVYADGKKGWLIYADHGAIAPTYSPDMIRIAFADALKCVSFPLTGLDGKWQDHDENKDTILCPLLHKTLRQHYRDHGTAKKKEEDTYWARMALQHYVDGDVDVDKIMATDWRYKVEYAFACKHFSVVTSRVYRAKVVPAPASEITEHELDDVTTTYLLVPSELDFATALKQFPQYHNYVLQWVLF